jgi:hypothetical protein
MRYHCKSAVKGLRLMMLASLLFSPGSLAAQCERGSRAQLDRSRPVPAKADVLAAWRRRQSAIHSFRFVWTEEQTHPRGWIANPRYAERERLAAPSLEDRHYVITKTLTVSGDSMRYSYTLDRRAEGDTTGNSDRRHYSYAYESVFDGRRNTARATSLSDTPPTVIQANDNRDAQNLDTRAILLALRPVDPILGDLLVDRAVPNLSRTIYRDHSTFLLEERRDPLGWKTILWIEPEREFLVTRLVLMFENTCLVDMDIDYMRDARYGWIPLGWRVTELLADGSRRLLSTAKVSKRAIE